MLFAGQYKWHAHAFHSRASPAGQMTERRFAHLRKGRTAVELHMAAILRANTASLSTASWQHQPGCRDATQLGSITQVVRDCLVRCLLPSSCLR